MNVIGICNQALGWLGANMISSLDDRSTESRLCNANYDALRDAMLETHPWTFATWPILLPASIKDDFNRGNKFHLATHLQIIRPFRVFKDISCYDNEIPLGWMREGEYIIAPSDQIVVEGIHRVVDPSKYSSGFCQAFAARLAADLAIPLTHSRQLQQDMWAMYAAKETEATAADAQQGRNRTVKARHLTEYARR